MDRLFLDANVLFSAAYQIDARLLQLWKIRNVTLCSSLYALEEARTNLAGEDDRIRLTQLSGALQLFEARRTRLPPGVFLPEKDVPIFLAAIEATLLTCLLVMFDTSEITSERGSQEL